MTLAAASDARAFGATRAARSGASFALHRMAWHGIAGIAILNAERHPRPPLNFLTFLRAEAASPHPRHVSISDPLPFLPLCRFEFPGVRRACL